MLNMRLRKKANQDNPVPNSIVSSALELSDKTWDCYKLMQELKNQFEGINDEDYNENYDLFKSLVKDIEQFSHNLSDMSEQLQNYDRIRY